MVISPPLLLAENYRLNGVFYKGISGESVELVALDFFQERHHFIDPKRRNFSRDVARHQNLNAAFPRDPVEVKFVRHKKIQLKKCGDSFAADHFGLRVDCVALKFFCQSSTESRGRGGDG